MESEEEYSIKIGDRFSNPAAIEERVLKYGSKNFVQFYVRDSKSIVSAKKRIKRYINPCIGQYQIHYCCIKGGKSFKSSSEGERSSSTFQAECKAFIRFTASEDGNALEVVGMNSDHNHVVSEELFRRYPQQRRLPVENQSGVRELLRLKANRKLVKIHIKEEHGKVILKKDLSNITASKKPVEESNLSSIVFKLQERYGADCHILKDDNNTFKGLFFSTPDMKRTMQAFPEYLGIDATHKLLDQRTPLYLIHSEDSNGMVEIVGACVLVSDDHVSMDWMLQTFKKENPSSSSTKCIMADKNLQDRALLKTHFPQANVLICKYHTLQTFNREISCQKLNITPSIRLHSLTILQKMVAASNVDEYNKFYEELQKGHENVVDYFNANWHGIRDEWSTCGKFNQGNFLNGTNYSLESINAKLKSVITPYSTLEDFVDSFFVIFKSLCDERDQKAAKSITKVPVIHFPPETPQYKYSNYLTEYAALHVANQLKHMPEVKVIYDDCIAGVYRISTSKGTVSTSVSTCTCMDSVSMLLPCRHIFAVRNYENIDLFNESLCLGRWTKKYYQENQRLFSSVNMDEGSISPTEVAVTPSRKLSTLSMHQKCRKVTLLTKDLVGLVSEATGSIFHQRVQVLLDLQSAWSNHKEVTVVGMWQEMNCDDQTPEDEDTHQPSCAEGGDASAGISPDMIAAFLKRHNLPENYF